MKLARYGAVVILAVTSFVALPSAIAEMKVADCAEFRNPTSTASATTITLRVDVYALCTVEQLGRGKGQSPLYEMPQEDSLLNLSSCSGPSISPIIGNGWLGTATCSLRVGSNTLPSPRTGATSTTIKMWFAWDFSSKTVSVSHTAIPAATNNGWGGSSSGSSSSSSSGSNSPVTKTCVSAPDTPTLSISWNERGPLFKFAPANSGEKTTVIDWNYALYDASSASWGAWSTWKEIYPATAGEYQANLEANKTKIAFSVYATNACGSSGQARELSTNTGVALAPAVQDEITLDKIDPALIRAGEQVDLYGLVSSKLSLALSGKSKTSNLCEVTDAGFVHFLESGECAIEFSSTSNQNKTGAPATSFLFKIKPKKIAQEIVDLKLNPSYDLIKSPITVSALTDAGLKVKLTALTDDVCLIAGDSLVFRNRGTCNLRADQDGDENTLAADTKYISIQVTQSRTTITCIKSKQEKKVSGLGPKCPAGYKVKK